MEAPQGFRLDQNSGLYYSEKLSKDSVTGAPVRLVTWFDPKSGISKQTSYPVAESAPATPQTSAPAPTVPVSAAASEPVPSVPKSKSTLIPGGFVLDPQSKLYYRSEQGVDAAGAPIQRVTYYDPVKRTYHAVDYPMKQTPATPETQPLPAPSEPPPDFSDVGTMLRQEQYRPVVKKKAVLPIAAACGAVLLALILGICAWQFGWFSKASSPATGSTPSAQGEKAGERSSTIAETYEYSQPEIGTLRLTFPDSKNFVLTYDYEGKAQTVEGTYTLDTNGIDITSDEAAPGWNGSCSFKRQIDDSLAILGPEIGDFEVYRVLSPVEAAD